MTEEQLRKLMLAEAARVGALAPPASTASVWHAARRARAMRLHLVLNLTGWAIRAGAAAVLGATAWLHPHALPAVALPSLLLLWLSLGIVRWVPKAIISNRLTPG